MYGARHGAGAEAAHDDRGVEQAEAEPVVLLGNEDGEPALLGDGLPQLVGVAVAVGVVVHLADPCEVEAVAQEVADGRPAARAARR